MANRTARWQPGSARELVPAPKVGFHSPRLHAVTFRAGRDGVVVGHGLELSIGVEGAVLPVDKAHAAVGSGLDGRRRGHPPPAAATDPRRASRIASRRAATTGPRRLAGQMNGGLELHGVEGDLRDAKL